MRKLYFREQRHISPKHHISAKFLNEDYSPPGCRVKDQIVKLRNSPASTCLVKVSMGKYHLINPEPFYCQSSKQLFDQPGCHLCCLLMIPFSCKLSSHPQTNCPVTRSKTPRPVPVLYCPLAPTVHYCLLLPAVLSCPCYMMVLNKLLNLIILPPCHQQYVMGFTF